MRLLGFILETNVPYPKETFSSQKSVLDIAQPKLLCITIWGFKLEWAVGNTDELLQSTLVKSFSPSPLIFSCERIASALEKVSVICLSPSALLLQIYLLCTGSQENGKVIHINKIHHQPLRVGLADPVALPCLFLLQTSALLGPNEPSDPPRIKWSKVQSATGQPEDISVLVAKDNVVKVSKGYEGRVSLPGYPHRRFNATLLLSAVRASDAGLYRCEVVAGIHDEQDLIPLEVTGEEKTWSIFRETIFGYCPVYQLGGAGGRH